MNDMPRKHTCPICKKETSRDYFPFCSKKCADIDLGRWLKGSYVIHTQEKPNDQALTQEDSPEE